MRLGWHGPSEVIVTACAAGTHAVAAAGRLVASGRCDVVVTGGAEAGMHPVAIAAFTNMTALSSSGESRPFDARRDGFVMTEGSAALVLEDWDRAVARGATIYAELAGVGQHGRRPPHHRAIPGRRRSCRLHGTGAGRRRHLARATSGTSTPMGPRRRSTTWPSPGPSTRSSASRARWSLRPRASRVTGWGQPARSRPSRQP